MSYLGIDIGGTKTFVALLDNNGVIQNQRRFETPKDYQVFLATLETNLAEFDVKNITATGVGVPGHLDRENGIAIGFGNLPWKEIPIKEDIHKLTGCPVVIENDAKLAGLSEAKILEGAFSKILYITLSTGIGTSLIVDEIIDTQFGDGGGNSLILEHDGKSVSWESFASGKAIVQRFGKRAEDIQDAATWRIIAADVAAGLIDLLAMVEPDVVVFGGGVGQFLPRFKKFLEADLKRFENPLLTIPPLRTAAQAEEAVIYGCYDLAKATYGRAG